MSPGTPSIELGTGTPCQWIVVSSARRFSTVTRNRVPGASVPLFTASGNHGLSGTAHADLRNWPQDVAVASSGGRYANDLYCCVNGTTATNYASSWYAFDAGPARFYVLTSAWGDTNPAILAWCEL